MKPPEPLYQRDPRAYQQHLAEGNARQARKRVGVDALLRDADGRILLVNPSYKPGWDLPGGMAEDNEAPDDALRRELAEELSLQVTTLQLLVLDWVAPHGPWSDSLMMIFDAGTLDNNQVANLRLTDSELTGFDFLPPQHAEPRLKPYYWRRVRAALDAQATGTVAYRRTDNFT